MLCVRERERGGKERGVRDEHVSHAGELCYERVSKSHRASLGGGAVS